MQESGDGRTLLTVTIHTLSLSLMALLSVIGNILVCLAFHRNRRLRTVTNCYVYFLAITDLIFACSVYPMDAIASALRRWSFGSILCQFNGFTSYLWVSVSINILALAAVNRYCCIVNPHFYSVFFTKKRAILSIIFVILFILCTFLAAIIVTGSLFRWHPYYLFCQATDFKGPVEAFILTFLIGFVFLPTCVTFVCYGRVYKVIRRHKSLVIPFLQQANNQRAMVSKHEIQGSWILLAAVVAFCICWIPATTVVILGKLAHRGIPPFWQSIHTLSSACSSWINPIIYGAMNRAMRKEFLKVIRCGKEN